MAKYGIKVYPLHLGDMWSDSNYTVMGDTAATVADRESPHRMLHTPSLAFLIDHPEAGWILFDTGMAANPQKAWPQFMRDSVLYDVPESMRIEHQLSLVGVKPAEISYVISSHMHMDHIGNDALFAKTADFFVGKAEAEHAYRSVLATTDPAARGYYIKDEVLLTRKSVTYIDQDTELFPGVEAIVCPGHTPGVVALLVHLNDGALILAEDALNEQRNYEGMLPGGVYDSIGYLESVRKIHDLAKKHRAQVFFGHDANQLATMKLAPEYYA